MATLEEEQRYVARKQCSVALQAVLTDFQFMEEALRLYIEAVYELIRFRLNKQVPFRLDYNSLEKDALGTLVTKFSQLSDKADLIAALRALVPKRNQCAHKGFLTSSYNVPTSQTLITTQRNWGR